MFWTVLEWFAGLCIAGTIVLVLWTTFDRHRDECDGTHQVKYERCF